MKNFAFVVCAALLGALSAGCMQFEYVGQSFPETPEAVPIPVYDGRSAIPEGKYAVIGRGVLTSPDTTDHYDVEEKLISEARDHGADAVCVVGFQSIQAGTFRTQDNPFIAPSASSGNLANLTPGGEPIAVNTYGSEVSGGQVHHRVEREIRVIFLKDKVELDRILAERDAKSKRERRAVDLPPPPSSPRPLTPEIREVTTP